MNKTNLITTKTLLDEADDLVLEHESLGLHIAIGKNKLYELLGKIYCLSEKLEASPDKKELVSGMRWDLAKRHNIKTQGNSSATSVLIRYVTRADRKNVHVYARAIECAKEHQIVASEFSNFLVSQGGVEKIRAISAQKNQLTTDEEAMEIVKNLLLVRAEIPYAQFELNQGLHQFGAQCTFDYFVAINTGGNQYRTLAKIDADTAFEEGILKSIASSLNLNNPESKERFLKSIERGLKLRKERMDQNGGKPWLERVFIKGEIPAVQQEHFETLFETTSGLGE